MSHVDPGLQKVIESVQLDLALVLLWEGSHGVVTVRAHVGTTDPGATDPPAFGCSALTLFLTCNSNEKTTMITRAFGWTLRTSCSPCAARDAKSVKVRWCVRARRKNGCSVFERVPGVRTGSSLLVSQCSV